MRILPGRLARARDTLLCALVAAALVAPVRAADEADMSKLDLSGAWYVLIHYKDASSEDKSIEKFKDFAWVIGRSDGALKLDEYPYVVFDEGSEEIRRFNMRAHKTWQPEGLVLSKLREGLDVSSRAMREKKLPGSVEKGYKSEPSLASGSTSMNFSRDWSIEFSPEKVRIQVVDSLSGGSDMLGEMEEAIVYEIRGRTPDGDLVGSYAEGDKSGKLLMIRAKERRIVK